MFVGDIYARLGQICYSTSNWDYGLSFLEWQTKLLYPADAITSATNAQKLVRINCLLVTILTNSLWTFRYLSCIV